MNKTDLELQADAFLAMAQESEASIARRTRLDNEFNVYARLKGGAVSETENINVRDPDVEKMIRRAMSDRHKADRAAKKAERFELMREASYSLKKKGIKPSGNADDAEKRLLNLLGFE